MLAKAPWRFKVIAAAVILFVAAPAALPAVPAMPFARGTIWIYEGTVAWRDETATRRRRIRLATEIIEAFNYPHARVALVRGFPSELAWYGDRPHPRYSLLILTETGLSEIAAESEREARRLARSFANQAPELMARSIPLVAFPLTEGQRFRSRVRGFRPSQGATSYQYIHRTNPDHTVIDFVPGLGVVRFVYEHHGTVSSVDVALTEIRRPRRRGTRRRPPS